MRSFGVLVTLCACCVPCGLGYLAWDTHREAQDMRRYWKNRARETTNDRVSQGGLGPASFGVSPAESTIGKLEQQATRYGSWAMVSLAPALVGCLVGGWFYRRPGWRQPSAKKPLPKPG